MFPRAHIILCRRDPRDVGWSSFTQYFHAEGMVWSDTLEECAAQIQLTERLTEHWLRGAAGAGA